jgi:hypothetical protein
MNMHEKGSNEGSNLIDHEKFYIYPPSTFYKLILGQQKLRTAFLQGREDDAARSKTSTNTINIEHSYKVKAILNSKSYYFHLARILLGLYDYRLKHIAIFDCNNDHHMTKPTIIKVEDDSFFKRGRMMRTSPLTVLLHKWMNATHQ